MISRERFEGLVKNADKNSIIWGVTDYTCHNNKTELRIEHFELCNMPTFYKNNIDKLFENYNHTEFFETKEDAEFALRYKRIPRIEHLDLPTFEEITTNDKYNYYGTSYFEFGDGYRLIVKLPSEDDDCEFIGIDVNGNCELYHWEEATKENYLEACRLCKKLFLGEENA